MKRLSLLLCAALLALSSCGGSGVDHEAFRTAYNERLTGSAVNLNEDEALTDEQIDQIYEAVCDAVESGEDDGDVADELGYQIGDSVRYGSAITQGVIAAGRCGR